MSNSKDEIEIPNDSLFGITVQTWEQNQEQAMGCLHLLINSFLEVM